MPECTKIVAMLSEYLDRDLPPDTCSTIDAHLEQCPECANAAVGLKQTVELCRKFRAEDRPGPLAADKQQELRIAFGKALKAIRHGPSDA